MHDQSTKTFCIFSALYFPSMGGVEKYTHELATALSSFGHKVIIVTSNLGESPSSEYVSENIEVFRLSSLNLLGGRLPITKKNAEFKRLTQALDQIHIDYVIVNTRFYRLSLIGLAYSRKRGIAPILIEHGSMHLTLGNPVFDSIIALYEHGITLLGKKYQASYYGVSSACENWLSHFKIKSQGSLFNAINAEEFAGQASKRDFKTELDLEDGTFIVSFTGRLTPEKGIQALLDAARLLEGQPAVFLIAGDGPLRNLVESKHLPNVVLLGRISLPDVAALMIQSDAFCLPTRSEGFSTSLLECAACATTPIITNVGGVKELISATGSGIVLGEASGEEVSSAILMLMNDRTLCQSMGLELKEYVLDHFTWQDTARLAEAACRKANQSNG